LSGSNARGVLGTGSMELTEFASLAVELGCMPALTDEELFEALLQLDNSDDGKVTFDEFWAWWVRDLVLGDSL
jgi:Ca2+-binding EF-hand superfamily protein